MADHDPATQRATGSTKRTRVRRGATTPPRAPAKPPASEVPAEDDYVYDDGPVTEEERVAARETLKPLQKVAEEATVRIRRRVYRGFDESKKKGTKKQQQTLKDWKGKHAGKQVDAMMHALANTAREKFGRRSVGVASEAEMLTIGIPCPLVFEILVQQDIFPLGIVVCLVGKEASLKTSLVYEFSRWFRLAKGAAVYVGNESKQSPDLALSILGREHEWCSWFNSRNLNEWQRMLTTAVDELQKMFTGTKNEPGPGRTIPVLFSVDSVMAKLSEESMKKIDEAGGTAGRAHPIEAMAITRYLQYIPQKIEDWPFSLVLVNQLKPSKDDQGKPVRHMPGGRQLQFQQTLEIETQITKSLITCDSRELGGPWKGRQIQLRLGKNSFGENHRRVDTRMIWKYELDEATGQKVQVTHFDWDWALVNYLVQLQGLEREALAEFLHIKVAKVGDATNSAWSRTLGVRESEPVSWSELGKMIQSNPELVAGIRNLFNVKCRPVLDGSIDYAEQLEQVSQELRS